MFDTKKTLDIAIYNKYTQLQVAIIVNSGKMSLDEVAYYGRSLTMHGYFPPEVPFALLVNRDFLYFWLKPNYQKTMGDFYPPHYTIAIQEVPLLNDRLKETNEKIGKYVFEGIICNWFIQLTHGQLKTLTPVFKDTWFEKMQLLIKINRGLIKTDVGLNI